MGLRGERGALIDKQRAAIEAEPETRYAYLVLPLVKLGTAQYNLDNMGRDGWKLVAVDNGLMFMVKEYSD